jgi:hypothetical protein
VGAFDPSRARLTIRVEDLFDNYPEAPLWQPDHGTFLYKGRDYNIAVNPYGKVTTVIDPSQ